MLDSIPKDKITSNIFVDLVTYKLPLIQSIYVAADLNIADSIGDKECDIKEIAKNVGACEDNLYRLMRVLAGFDIFSEVNDRCFINTTNSNMLRKDFHESVYNLVLWDAGELTWKSLEGLGNCVRKGTTAFDTIFNMPFFNYLENNPFHKQRLYNALSAFKQILIPQIKNSYDFSRFKKIVDIGGGEGDLLLELQNDHPNIKYMLYDLEEIVSPLRKRDLQIEIMGGNIFKDQPPQADCYILKLILHDWNNERCVQILKNCSKSLEQGGKLLLVEPALIQGSPHEQFSKMLDLDMMILTGGKERTPEEYRALFNASGLELSNVIATETPLYIIEASKH
jgi:hypothetical protein